VHLGGWIRALGQTGLHQGEGVESATRKRGKNNKGENVTGCVSGGEKDKWVKGENPCIGLGGKGEREKLRVAVYPETTIGKGKQTLLHRRQGRSL